MLRGRGVVVVFFYNDEAQMGHGNKGSPPVGLRTCVASGSRC